jgi:hypothetical protein
MLATLDENVPGDTEETEDKVVLKNFALKIIYKEDAAKAGIVKKLLNELHMLSQRVISEHPLVPKLVGRFQTADALVMVMERVSTAACDLWALIYDMGDKDDDDKSKSKKSSALPSLKETPDAHKISRRMSRRTSVIPGIDAGEFSMSPDMVKFYVASVVLVLSDLHKAGIAFRNLKAENVLLDTRGYIKLTGFGYAKTFPFMNGQHMKNRTHTMCGTAEYMAPGTLYVPCLCWLGLGLIFDGCLCRVFLRNHHAHGAQLVGGRVGVGVPHVRAHRGQDTVRGGRGGGAVPRRAAGAEPGRGRRQPHHGGRGRGSIQRHAVEPQRVGRARGRPGLVAPRQRLPQPGARQPPPHLAQTVVGHREKLVFQRL